MDSDPFGAWSKGQPMNKATVPSRRDGGWLAEIANGWGHMEEEDPRWVPFVNRTDRSAEARDDFEVIGSVRVLTTKTTRTTNRKTTNSYRDDEIFQCISENSTDSSMETCFDDRNELRQAICRGNRHEDDTASSSSFSSSSVDRTFVRKGVLPVATPLAKVAAISDTDGANGNPAIVDKAQTAQDTSIGRIPWKDPFPSKTPRVLQAPTLPEQSIRPRSDHVSSKATAHNQRAPVATPEQAISRVQKKSWNKLETTHVMMAPVTRPRSDHATPKDGHGAEMLTPEPASNWMERKPLNGLVSSKVPPLLTAPTVSSEQSNGRQMRNHWIDNASTKLPNVVAAERIMTWDKGSEQPSGREGRSPWGDHASFHNVPHGLSASPDLSTDRDRVMAGDLFFPVIAKKAVNDQVLPGVTGLEKVTGISTGKFHQKVKGQAANPQDVPTGRAAFDNSKSIVQGSNRTGTESELKLVTMATDRHKWHPEASPRRDVEMTQSFEGTEVVEPISASNSQVNEVIEKFGGRLLRKSSIQLRKEELEQNWARSRIHGSGPSTVKTKWEPNSGSRSYKKKILVTPQASRSPPPPKSSSFSSTSPVKSPPR